MSLTLASQTIGFISFSITILTLIGVYRDAISTIRGAPTQIPIMLGNLRQEILSERAFLKYRMREGDMFRVFPASIDAPSSPQRKRQRRGGRNSRRREREQEQFYAESQTRKQAFTALLNATMKDLWTEFRNIERPFLIRNRARAAEVSKGDYWGDSDVDEKRDVDIGKDGFPRNAGKRRKGNLGDDDDVEAAGRRKGVFPAELNDGWVNYCKDYYHTDFTHRFIWWRLKGKVDDLLNQVQRIQIRRIERDVFETDELVKRMLRNGRFNGGRGGGRGGGSGSDSSSDSGSAISGRSGVRKRRTTSTAVRSRPGSVRAATPSRRVGGVGGVRGYREVDEREIIRRGRRRISPSPSPPRTRVGAAGRPSDVEASNTGRRRERRSEPVVEYEVVRPGRIYVDTDVGGTYGRDRSRTRNYSRDR